MGILSKVEDHSSALPHDWALMGDAAFAGNLDGTDFEAVGFYLQSPNAFHPWTDKEIFEVPGPKLPIYVANSNGINDAHDCIGQLQALHVPKGKVVAYDMETRIDKTLCAHFEGVMVSAGYRVWIYGSASTVFENPSINGYWVADYRQTLFMYNHMQTRATQCIEGNRYDTSTVKRWILDQNQLWK
jgi:hypothetical protein